VGSNAFPLERKMLVLLPTLQNLKHQFIRFLIVWIGLAHTNYRHDFLQVKPTIQFTKGEAKKYDEKLTVSREMPTIARCIFTERFVFFRAMVASLPFLLRRRHAWVHISFEDFMRCK
jgi:hypothetical protein